jgi:hypothetical protein
MSGIVANATVIFFGFVINGTMIFVVKNDCDLMLLRSYHSGKCVVWGAVRLEKHAINLIF